MKNLFWPSKEKFLILGLMGLAALISNWLSIWFDNQYSTILATPFIFLLFIHYYWFLPVMRWLNPRDCSYMCGELADTCTYLCPLRGWEYYVLWVAVLIVNYLLVCLGVYLWKRIRVRNK